MLQSCHQIQRTTCACGTSQQQFARKVTSGGAHEKFCTLHGGCHMGATWTRLSSAMGGEGKAGGVGGKSQELATLQLSDPEEDLCSWHLRSNLQGMQLEAGECRRCLHAAWEVPHRHVWTNAAKQGMLDSRRSGRQNQPATLQSC
jgi:hypothetical protein